MLGSIENIFKLKQNERDSMTISRFALHVGLASSFYGVSKKRRYMEIKRDNGNIKLIDLKPFSVNRTNPGCQKSIMDNTDS